MARSLIFKGFNLHFGDLLEIIELKNMFLLSNPFWVFIWSCFVHVFCFISRNPLSILGKNSAEIRSDFEAVCKKLNDGIDENENDDVGCDLFGKKEIPKLDSKVGNFSNAITSKYEFISGNSVCGFVEEPQNISYTVQEMFVISNYESPNEDDFFGISDESVDALLSDEIVDSNSSEHHDCDELDEEIVEKQGKTECSASGLNSTEHEFYEQKENVIEKIVCEHDLYDNARSSVSDSNEFWASIHKFDDFSFSDGVLDSDSDEMLWDKRVNFDDDSPRSLVDFLLEQNGSYLGSVNVDSEEEDIDFRYIEIEPQSGKFRVHSEKHLSRNEFDQEKRGFDDLNGVDVCESCEEEGDQSEMDVLLEQKELIRQMKKEMRHLKIGGLPTILEEYESPRVEDDLRPLKIDERIGHKDFMDEIQTLYKKYLDKMKRLDILSQQTMYGIGLLHLKNQDQIASKNKVSSPVIKSLLAQNLWSYKLIRKHETDPVEILIRDLQRDLELAYVSQLCLSWEILKWQHHKSQELHAFDPDGFRQHNQVAGEFQKFQVLLQRFTEDEPFHPGPRIQHYVKSRCSLPNLLQVPLIKDDPRGDWRGKGEGGISIGMLKEVIGASMRTFWEFLHADKDEFRALALMGIHAVDVDLQDSSDTELLSEVHSRLQKKEKRLKDLLRSGNCLVRKFQKNQNQQLSHEMFLAQVELRLVSRVLNMSRLTTDQLLWCHKKLSKINIIGRKVYLDSSFLLFPC